MSDWIKLNSLQNKILIPFSVIVVVMTTLSLAAAYFLVVLDLGDLLGPHTRFMSALCLIVINVGVFATYAKIIKTVTTPLQRLSLIVQQMKDNAALGSELASKEGLQPSLFDLDTQDEIEELAQAFYDIMVRNLSHKKQIEQLRESFLRTVTHELRTPLTSIIGFIELISKSDSLHENDKKHLLTLALNESKNLKSLIEDLLDLSRIQAGKVALQFSSVSVSDLMDSVANSLRPLAKNKPLTLEVIHPALPIIVISDAPKLRRILVNLISNAIKFTPQGKIVITSYETLEEVIFSVSDTGIGIKDEEKDSIFEAFRQADSSETREYEGIGVGLSIVKELVELHQGRIWVESKFGEGSVFSFSVSKNLTETVVSS